LSSIFEIKTEDDAWKIVELWLNDEPIPSLAFDRWPSMQIDIRGQEYKSSIRSGQMQALLGFQASMGRAYAAIAHGAYDMRRLTKDESEHLQFTTTVRSGSTLSNTDLSPLVQAVANAVNAHPTATLIGALVIGLAFVAKPIILKHFENRSKQLDISEREKLIGLLNRITDEDKRKWKLMEDAVSRLNQYFPSFQTLLPDASASFWRLASSSTNATSVEIEGILLRREDLESLAEKRSRVSRESRTTRELFEVLGVNKFGKFYRVHLKAESYSIFVTFGPPEGSEEKVKTLLTCMTDSKCIHALINITLVDKSQVIGRLLEFVVIESP